MSEFNIIRYMSTLTGYSFDNDTLERIALERGVIGIDSFADLTQRDKDLMRADMLFVVYTTPTIKGSRTKKHGTFEDSIGSETITDKRHIYELMMSLYRKWEDEMAETVEEMNGGLSWIE